MSSQPLHPLRPHLDALYRRYNRRHFVDPDPLAAVYPFDDPADVETAALVASALAFGGVKQILASIAAVLGALGPPGMALRRLTDRQVRTRLAGFRHRYVTDADLAGLVAGARRAVETHGSLGAAFTAALQPGDADVVPALTRFAALLHGGRKNYLLPDPARGSACKRWMLYLRWMVRKDAVDLGLWRGVPPTLLVVPMDTHMHRVALRLGLTARRTADLRAARETTAAFRLVRPDDPVRYDFALTRLGIRRDDTAEAFFAACAQGQSGA